MFTKLIDLRRELDIEKKLKEQFPEPEYKINDSSVAGADKNPA